MKTALTTTVSRRDWLSRLVLAAAVVPALGGTRTGDVDAKVNTIKTKTSIKTRVQAVREICEIGGGTATISKRPGGTTVSCNGGDSDGYTCTVTKKHNRCFTALTNSPATNAGGGGAVPPSGGNEDPTDGTDNNAGGGADVPPGGSADPNGGESDPVLE